jgi:hypothetical protein
MMALLLRVDYSNRLFLNLYTWNVCGGTSESVFVQSAGCGDRQIPEIVDRPEAQSVVHNGPFGAKYHGVDQASCWKLSVEVPESERFPLLIKFSITRRCCRYGCIPAHPQLLKAEPKTKPWYVAQGRA